MGFFECSVCGYIHEGEVPPDKCPICKAPASEFLNDSIDNDNYFMEKNTIHSKSCNGCLLTILIVITTSLFLI